MTTTFETAEAGDRVWCMVAGWGEVQAIDSSRDYPIAVCFKGDDIQTYTVGGFFAKDDIRQTLFWDEIVFEVPVKPRSAATLSADEKQISALRDQFAMHAMNGLLSNSGGVIQPNSFSGTGYVNCSHDDVAAWAYELADAMLKERDK